MGKDRSETGSLEKSAEQGPAVESGADVRNLVLAHIETSRRCLGIAHAKMTPMPGDAGTSEYMKAVKALDTYEEVIRDYFEGVEE